MQVIQGPRFIIVLGTASSKLELGEGLLGPGRLGHLQGVVLHSLAQGPGVKGVQMSICITYFCCQFLLEQIHPCSSIVPWSPALSDSEGITNGGVSEARRKMDRDVLVPLLEPGVVHCNG